MAQFYDIGDRPTLVAAFRDVDGQLADPTLITFQIKDPAGTVTAGDETDATNPAPGVWRWQIPAAFDSPGTWWLRAEATSGLQTAEETSVAVRPSQFP